VRITPDDGYSITSFVLGKKRVEVFIHADDGSEGWALDLEPAAEGEEVVIRKIADSTEIVYVRR
jgi:hypothetical protein